LYNERLALPLAQLQAYVKYSLRSLARFCWKVRSRLCQQ